MIKVESKRKLGIPIRKKIGVPASCHEFFVTADPNLLQRLLKRPSNRLRFIGCDPSVHGSAKALYVRLWSEKNKVRTGKAYRIFPLENKTATADSNYHHHHELFSEPIYS